MSDDLNRRGFIQLGVGALATLGVGEVIRLWPGEPSAGERDVPPQGTEPALPNDYRRATAIPGVCLNCSTVCGIVGYVIDGKLVKVGGNPKDPNNGPHLCAKGQSGPTINDYPERMLYPLLRMGPRDEAIWKRITWDEAYAEELREAFDLDPNTRVKNLSRGQRARGACRASGPRGSLSAPAPRAGTSPENPGTAVHR